MKRLRIISLFAVLFIAFVIVWNFSYQTGLQEAYVPKKEEYKGIKIPSEAGVFERSMFALSYMDVLVDKTHQRSMSSYYNNRAFPGAPPAVPHPPPEDGSIGGKSCLKCHRDGGFVSKYNAYAPVTPHPEETNCRQCHVAIKTKSNFVANYFRKRSAPKVGENKVFPTGSPPIIPHSIQMRENCLACHAGPSAPKEIRVPHPERVNCRQCHVPTNGYTADEIFKRVVVNE